MARYDVYLHLSLLDAVPSRGAQRREIVAFIRGLCDHPGTPGDFIERDPSFRQLQVKLIGEYAVSYWLDDPAKTVMIVNVEPAD